MSLTPPEGWTVFVYPQWPEKIPAEQPIVLQWEGPKIKGRKRLLRFTHRLCGEAFHVIDHSGCSDFPDGGLAIFDRHWEECPAMKEKQTRRKVKEPESEEKLVYKQIKLDL